MKKQCGYTVIEVFVALAVGIFLLIGVLTIFVDLKTTSEQTTDSGELQENGRFALALIADDLRKQNFFGDFVGTLTWSNVNPVPNDPNAECSGEGFNNGTFPQQVGHFRTLWGTTVTTASPMSCILNAAVYGNQIATDLIQIKRVIGNPLLATGIDNYYFVSNPSSGRFFTGGNIPVIDNSQVWEYQHRIYYVSLQGVNNIPVLMQARLTNQMTIAPVVDGIEVIRFMYGVDLNEDGIVNQYLSANNMTEDLWDLRNNARVISVKIFVLARNLLPSNNYENTNTYLVGDMAMQFNDNFRRMLFTTTVQLANASERVWAQ
ncbi:PilW family protein [Thalassotalea ganghwensis]